VCYPVQPAKQYFLGRQFHYLYLLPDITELCIRLGGGSPALTQRPQRPDDFALPSARDSLQLLQALGRALDCSRVEPAAAKQQADIDALFLQLKTKRLHTGSGVAGESEGPEIGRVHELIFFVGSELAFGAS